MNFNEIIESELTNILTHSKRQPNITKLIENALQTNNFDSVLQELLPLIIQSKNNKLINSTIMLIQKLDSASKITNIDFESIAEFSIGLKQVNDENNQIKMISTLIHLIGPRIIDFNNLQQLTSIINILLLYSESESSITQQSSIHGLTTLVDTLSQLIVSETSIAPNVFELIEIFFAIFQDKSQNNLINSQANSILSKDIFIMLLKCGKQVLLNQHLYTKQQYEIFYQFYEEQLYEYLLSIEILNEFNLLLRINKIRLLFTYIFIMDDKYDLLQQIMNNYCKMNLFDVSKLVIHDGLLILYQNPTKFNEMFNNVPKDCSDYNELIMKGLYIHTLSEISMYNSQPSPKQTQLSNRLSASYLEINQKLIPNYFVYQTKLLIQIITDNLNKLSEGDHTLKILVEQKIQQQLDNNTNAEESREEVLNTPLDKLWRPLLKILRVLLKLFDQAQYSQTLEFPQQWMKVCLKLNLAYGYEQLVRFFAQQCAPAQLKFIENDKWISAYQSFIPAFVVNSQLTPKTWNLIFQSFQRIEQVIPKDFDCKICTEIFLNSGAYSDQIIYKMLDGMNQLALQVSERLQISTKKNFDSIFKSFAIEKLYLIVNCNWHRIEKIWSLVEALNLCLCGSKVMEMRLNAINCLKEIIMSGFEYFNNNSNDKWDDYSLHLITPLQELIISPFDDVGQNSLHLLVTVLRDQGKQISQTSLAFIVKQLENVVNDLLLKMEASAAHQDLSVQEAKALYLKVVLALNSLTEIVFNQIQRTDHSTMMRLASIMIQLNKHDNFISPDLQNKVICMIWSVEENLLQQKISNPRLLEISFKLIKESTQGLDDLRYASIHIAASLCKASCDELFNECFEVLEDLIQMAVQNYLKLEHAQLQIMYQTPRFTNQPIDTPKFQQNTHYFDKTTSLQIFKSLLELVKLSIIKITEVIIHKKNFKRFYYYITLFNQAQCYYLRHQVLVASHKILIEYPENQLLNLIIDLAQQITVVENQEFEDLQYYLESGTLKEICDINQMAFTKDHTRQFVMLNQLFLFQCNEILLSYVNDDNNIYKYYLKNCFQIDTYNKNQLEKWMQFITDQLINVGIQLKYHQYIDFLLSLFEQLIEQCFYKIFFSKIQHDQDQLIRIQTIIIEITQLLQKCWKMNCDNSERLNTQLTIRLKSILLKVADNFNIDQLHLILEPLLLNQRKKKQQEWINFIISDLSKLMVDDKLDNLITLLNNHLLKKLSAQENKLTVILSLIILLEQEGTFVEKLKDKLLPELLSLIKDTLIEFITEIDSSTYEKQFNIIQMLTFLESLEPVYIKQFYKELVQMIRIESLDVRLKISCVLAKLE